MTITRTCYRNNGMECEPITHTQTLNQAMVSLLAYEYGYGGFPVRVEPELVEVHTRVFNCLDRTVWVGPAAEIAPLMEVSRYVAVTFTKPVTDALAEAVAPKLLDVTEGSPLLVAGLAGMFTGAVRLRAACLLWCDGPKFSAESVDRAKRLSMEDFVSVAVLAKESGQSFLQTCTQLGVE